MAINTLTEAATLYPEDRVLVGVINRKRDLNYALQEHWYRIPQRKMKRGIETEYVALFLSSRILKDQPGGIYYYSRVRGIELAHRYDLLPQERKHRRAHEWYYRLALATPSSKQPPILNPSRRPIAFIFTTWDRFMAAETINDLYSESDQFVTRIERGLRRGIP